MLQILRLLEHVFAEHAMIKAGRRDRAHVVEASRADSLGKAHCVARAVNIGRHLSRGIGIERIDRAQVEDVVDPVFQRRQIIGGNAQSRLGQVAGNRDGAVSAAPPIGPQLFNPLDRGIAQQEIHGGPGMRQQRADEPLADKAAGTGNEIDHICVPNRAMAGCLCCAVL